MERGGHGGFIGAKRGSGSRKIGLFPGQWRRWLREHERVLYPERSEREVGDDGRGAHQSAGMGGATERRGARASEA